VGQTGFFDLQNRLDSLDAMGDPLDALNQVVPWEDFRSMLRQGLRNKDRKSVAGRPPYDEVLMFKVLVLRKRPVAPCIQRTENGVGWKVGLVLLENRGFRCRSGLVGGW